jgi:hypothetical protein
MAPIYRGKAPIRRSVPRAVRTGATRLVPDSGLVEDLVRAVGTDRGRVIRLLPVHLDARSASGMWIATPRADYVVHPMHVSAAERTAIICHELAHMLLRHRPITEDARIEQLLATVAPTIDRAVARRFLARHWYDEEAEAEAESLATHLFAELARREAGQRLIADYLSTRLR